jgi:hypothetical protein
LKIKNQNLTKNSYLESIDLANLMGIDGSDDEQRHQFLKRLRKLDIRKKPGTQGGKAKKFHLGDTLSELAFYTKNERNALAGDGINYQKARKRREFDKGLNKINAALRKNIVNRLEKTDIAIPKISLAEDLGHAESVEIIETYPNLFKGSNVKSLQTLVRQDPDINQKILVDQGYHSQNGAIYKQLKNKKINIAEANNLLKLNNERIKRIIRKEARNNPFFRGQENRIALLQINKNGIVNADMSTVDPFYIYGNINKINPKANKVSDLSKKQLNMYLKNLKNQWTDGAAKFISSLKDNQGNRIYSNKDIEEFRDILELPVEGPGSKYKFQKGGPVELSPMPRMNFSEGTKPEEGDTFAKELEYFFLNPDAELPKPQSYKETMNPIEIVNDMIDPRNVPYYADVLTRSGIRVGEFATRIIPAVGKLASDLIRKPAFKVTGTGGNYIQDYGETTPFNIKGTGIFTEFLENITPTATEKAIGLDKLIQQEEQKQKDRRSTIGPKVLADTIGLGVEVTAPIFPGIKLLNAYAKTKNLPTDKVTTELLQKDIDKVLSERGLDRRQFLQATGASATIVLAKMLGLGDEVAQSTKVAEKAAETVVDTTPQHFFDLADLIKFYGKEGVQESPRARNIYWKNYELMEDISTGEMRIIKTNEGGARTADGDIVDGIFSEEVMEFKPGEYTEGPDGKFVKTPDEYTEATITPDIDGKMKEFEDGIDETSISKMIEDIDEAGGEEILDKIRFTDK